jgi:8-oxo-dGTP diphosphatase
MNRIQVAVGVVTNSSGQVLLSRRHQSAHQGGLWEFPGGKLEPGEPVLTALLRELDEELGLRVETASPLIRIRHQYPDRSVLLRVFRVDAHSGRAVGMEGQEIRWVNPVDLGDYEFPEANRPIISALRLPDVFPILNDDGSELFRLERRFREWMTRGVKIFQFRTSRPWTEQSIEFFQPLFQKAHAARIDVIINGPPGVGVRVGAAGLHLNSQRLLEAKLRPSTGFRWVGASCHNLDELLHAQNLGLDYAFLSPVSATRSHPRGRTLGWNGFEALVDQVNIPVFALGGMTSTELKLARNRGGQGIAGISAFAK